MLRGIDPFYFFSLMDVRESPCGYTSEVVENRDWGPESFRITCKEILDSSNLNNYVCDIVELRFATCKRPRGAIYTFSEM